MAAKTGRIAKSIGNFLNEECGGFQNLPKRVGREATGTNRTGEQVCFALIYFDWVCRTDRNRDQDQDQRSRLGGTGWDDCPTNGALSPCDPMLGHFTSCPGVPNFVSRETREMTRKVKERFGLRKSGEIAKSMKGWVCSEESLVTSSVAQAMADRSAATMNKAVTPAL